MAFVHKVYSCCGKAFQHSIPAQVYHNQISAWGLCSHRLITAYHVLGLHNNDVPNTIHFSFFSGSSSHFRCSWRIGPFPLETSRRLIWKRPTGSSCHQNSWPSRTLGDRNFKKRLPLRFPMPSVSHPARNESCLWMEQPSSNIPFIWTRFEHLQVDPTVTIEWHKPLTYPWERTVNDGKKCVTFVDAVSNLVGQRAS